MSKQTPPSSVQEDDTYPVHTLDDIKANRKFVSWTMLFNDVLDAEKLHNALSKLLEIGDWRKLGGRLRLKENGKLETCVPRPFTAERPAVLFTHDAFDTKIEEHPVACRFPQPTDGPSIQPASADFRPFAARPDFPTTIDELIHQNLPQMSLHITSFSDATLVGLAWPHTMMDAMGQQALLHAWSLVLAGREGEVPSVLGAREDVLGEAESLSNDGSQEEFKLDQKRLKGLGATMFISRYLWDKLRNPPVELRAVYLPKQTFTRLQRKAQQEVAQVSQSSNQKPFISECDILTAWVTRIVASSESKSRPVIIGSLLNTRFRLPLLVKLGGVYLQNMVLMTYTFLSAQLARGTVGPIALSNRRHLAEQATEQQTLSFLKAVFQDLKSDKSPRLLFGESNALPIIFNNLTKVELIKAAKFGAAVERQGEKTESRTNPLGTMVTYYNRALDQPPEGLNSFFMLGKDYGENYWLMGNLLPRAWARMEEELRNI